MDSACGRRCVQGACSPVGGSPRGSAILSRILPGSFTSEPLQGAAREPRGGKGRGDARLPPGPRQWVSKEDGRPSRASRAHAVAAAVPKKAGFRVPPADGPPPTPEHTRLPPGGVLSEVHPPAIQLPTRPPRPVSSLRSDSPAAGAAGVGNACRTSEAPAIPTAGTGLAPGCARPRQPAPPTGGLHSRNSVPLPGARCPPRRLSLVCRWPPRPSHLAGRVCHPVSLSLHGSSQGRQAGWRTAHQNSLL